MNARSRIAAGTSPRPPVESRWPVYAEDELAVVQRVLASGRVNYWTGEESRAFEREFAAAHGSAFGVALCNGTAALETALHALDVGPGDEVVVTPRTFIASISAIVRQGARPVFADVDHASQNLTVATIRPVLSARTRAVVCVHLAGWPCDMPAILELARKHGLAVIEDVAQAHGATIDGRPVGSFGDIAAFSFCQDKIMSTGGEGGMLTTSDPKLWQRAWGFKDHGKSWQAVYERRHPPGFRWLHESFGTNARLTEAQAAIGRLQLEKLPRWLEARRANAGRLLQRLSRIPGLRVPRPPARVGHAYYRAYAFVRPERLAEGWDRDRIMREVTIQGVPCLAGSCSEVYRERAFDGTDMAPETRLPVARELGATSLMFPVDPTLDAAAMDRIAEAVEEVMARASAGHAAKHGHPDFEAAG